jgi:hypothetical protein
MRGVKQGDLEAQRLLTDRSAYLSFLESQLERVSATCLTVVGFQSRLESLQSQVVGIEAAQANNARRIEINAEERRARGAKKSEKEAEKEAEKEEDVKGKGEETKRQRDAAAAALRERVAALETLVQRMAVDREEDGETIRNLEKRVSDYELASRVPSPAPRLADVVAAPSSASSSSSTTTTITSSSSPGRRVLRPVSLDRLDELVQRMAADRGEDAKTIRDLAKRLSRQEASASSSASNASDSSPDNTTTTTRYATKDMLRKLEQKCVAKIAQLSSRKSPDSGSDTAEVLRRDLAKLAGRVTLQESASDEALKKHAECIVDQRAAINSLAKHHATAITDCRSTLQKHIDALNAAVEQQNATLSQHSAREQESRVVAHLESKVQKRFHALRDEIYEKSMKQQKVLINECAARIKVQEDRHAKRADDSAYRIEYFEQQLKTFAAQQDSRQHATARNLTAFTRRLQVTENISVASKRASQKILDLLEAQQKNYHETTERAMALEQGMKERVVEIVQPEIARAILRATLAEVTTLPSFAADALSGSGAESDGGADATSTLDLRLDAQGTLERRSEAEERPEPPSKSDKESARNALKRQVSHEVALLRRGMEQTLLKECNRLVEGKIGALTQDDLDACVARCIGSRLATEVDAAVKERLRNDVDSSSSSSSSPSSTDTAIQDLRDSLTSIEMTYGRMDDVRDTIAVEIATVRRSLRLEMDAKIKTKFGTTSKALEEHVQRVVTRAVSKAADVLQATVGGIRHSIDKRALRIAASPQVSDGGENKTGKITQQKDEGDEQEEEVGEVVAMDAAHVSEQVQGFAERREKRSTRSDTVCAELQQLRDDLNRATVEIQDNMLTKKGMGGTEHRAVGSHFEELASPSVGLSFLNPDEQKGTGSGDRWKDRLGTTLGDLSLWQTDEFDVFEDDAALEGDDGTRVGSRVLRRKRIQTKTKKKTKKSVQGMTLSTMAKSRKKKKGMKIAKKKTKKKNRGGRRGGGALGFDPERIAKLKMALSRQQKLKSAGFGR